MQAVHHYYIGCVYTSVRQGPQQRGTHPQLEFLGGLRFALPPYKFAATSFWVGCPHVTSEFLWAPAGPTYLIFSAC